jgi:hypothetical protein
VNASVNASTQPRVSAIVLFMAAAYRRGGSAE